MSVNSDEMSQVRRSASIRWWRQGGRRVRYRRAGRTICWMLAALLLGLTPAGAACNVQQAASVPLNVIDQTPLVTVELNGQPATFILDTGAARSVVTEAAVQRLGVARDAWIDTSMRGVGGIVRRPNADPKSLSLGGVRLERRTLSRDTSLTVGDLPRSQVGNYHIDGLLGRDFLSSFDLDVDMPASRVTLYRVDGCAGRFISWRQPYEVLSATMLPHQALLLPVLVNGVQLRALLDTGATSSFLAAPGMYRLGLNVSALSGDPAATISGLGPRQVIMRRHHFQSMQVGRQVLSGPALWINPAPPTVPMDMLLGADYLISRRVWISFATAQVFVAEAAGRD